MPSATPGTIAEYDMVFAISKDAIDAQFQLLFGDDDDSLISQDLKLGYMFVDRL